MEENKQIYIVKANGERELFDSGKLENSLRKADADARTIAKILKTILSELKDGITTKEIYQQAFELLNKTETPAATKYSVRKAVMELGPDGHSFENFIGAMFRATGYEVRLRRTIKGLCVSHEIDMIAQNNEQFIVSEIKFHNRQGMKSNLKVILYVKERFDDLEKSEFWRNVGKDLKKEKWLITNTKFTSKAIRYAGCCAEGLKLVSWNYPEQGNLHQLIDEAYLYPLTCLKTLSKYEKKLFLEKNVVLCRELRQGGERLFNLVGISPEKRRVALEEIDKLVG